jgi:hypothetical protein
MVQFSSAMEPFGLDVSLSIFGVFHLFMALHVPALLRDRNNQFGCSLSYATELCQRVSQCYGPASTVTVYALADFAKQGTFIFQFCYKHAPLCGGGLMGRDFCR